MGRRHFPFAAKVATGKACAVTGEAWVNRLNRDPQDYVVLPEQPWLDGYCESFIGKLRDECLNQEIFYSLKEARIVIEQ